ncbi:MAG: hypothetical protein ACI9JD_000913 [Rhodococcus sp. (in: high G+C Gram-positive bacteria)]|jgi:hypothetical protein
MASPTSFAVGFLPGLPRDRGKPALAFLLATDGISPYRVDLPRSPQRAQTAHLTLNRPGTVRQSHAQPPPTPHRPTHHLATNRTHTVHTAPTPAPHHANPRTSSRQPPHLITPTRKHLSRERIRQRNTKRRKLPHRSAPLIASNAWCLGHHEGPKAQRSHEYAEATVPPLRSLHDDDLYNPRGFLPRDCKNNGVTLKGDTPL